MPKRAAALHAHLKSTKSPKTKKRLAIKKVMLETKKAKRKSR